MVSPFNLPAVKDSNRWYCLLSTKIYSETAEFALHQGCVLPVKDYIHTHTLIKSYLLKKKFSFLSYSFVNRLCKPKKYVVKCNLERQWSTEEGLESCHRADWCNWHHSDELAKSLAVSPRLGDVEVVGSVFCHIRVVFNLADGIRPSPWEKRKSLS